MRKIIACGAEALLIKENKILKKKRITKGYRHPQLDKKIRTQRTRREAKLLEKASKLVNVPKVLSIKNTEIEMQYVEGKKLSENLDRLPLKKQIKICYQLGEQIAELHNNHIIHGDLTTSNIILKNDKIYFIDFGLGFQSARIEDKAVDLHLLRQALESRHFKNWQDLFAAVIEGYRKVGSLGVLEQLKKVESRGRYKGKFNGKQPMIV
ncbi:MAG: KEOPS complex kinase/ATPase Bud32 [Candidatus Pacearchaeota archaeon]